MGSSWGFNISAEKTSHHAIEMQLYTNSGTLDAKLNMLVRNIKLYRTSWRGSRYVISLLFTVQVCCDLSHEPLRKSNKGQTGRT